MGLVDELGDGEVAIDASILIYFIEQHEEFAPAVNLLFDQAIAGARTLVASAMSLLEVLVVPYRAGDLALAAKYETLLTRSAGLRLIEIDRGQLRAAAQLRAAYSVRTPDALHLAAAMTTGCKTFLTNDRRMPKVRGLRIVQVGRRA